MYFIIFAAIKCPIFVKGCLPRLVYIVCKAIIQLLNEFGHNEGDTDSNKRHDRVDNHCLGNLQADVQVPLWHVIMIGPLHVTRDELRLMLCGLRVD